MNVIRSALRFLVTGSSGIATVAVVFLGLHELTQSEGEAGFEILPIQAVDFGFRPPAERLETKRKPKPVRDEVDVPELPESHPLDPCMDCDASQKFERAKFEASPDRGIRHRMGPLVGGSDVDVQPIVRVLPEYPPNGRGDGWVLVQFDITKIGSVANVRVVDASPRGVFEKNALKAIERWRYRPAVMDGQAVERRGLRVRLSFVLEKA